MNTLLVYPETNFVGTVPLGLASIAAYAQKFGYNIDIFSCQGKSVSELQTKLMETNWDLIGFTALISQYKDLKKLVSIARSIQPLSFIVLGGALANAIPEFAVDHLDINMAVCGEGELPFLQLLQSHQNERSAANVSGGVYRDESGTVICNSKMNVLSMDDIPLLPYSGFDIEPYTNRPHGRSIDIQLSRGCPNSCSFCDNSLFPKHIRRRSRQNMYNELQRIRETYDFDLIYLADLNPFLARGLMSDFCEVVNEIEFEGRWYANGFAKAMSIRDLDVLTKAKCGGLHFGIESGSKDVLAVYNKHVDFEKSKTIIKNAVDRGIEVQINWIIGAPNESMLTVRESIEYFVSLGVVPAIRYLTPLPGTPMYQLAVDKGSISDLEDYLLGYKNWYDNKPLCNISKFTDEELVRIAHDATAEISSRVGTNSPQWSGLWRGGYGFGV